MVSGESAAKRDSARRARRLALQLMNETDRSRLLAYADQLDAEALALDQGQPPPTPPPVTFVQQQPQQQATSEGSDGKPGPGETRGE